MNKVERIARWIWSKKVVKEGVLLIVSAVVVTLALQLNDLLAILNSSDVPPLNEIKAWVSGTVVAVLVTGVKQAVVYFLQLASRNRTSTFAP